MKPCDFFSNASIFVGDTVVSVPELAAHAKANLEVEELTIEWFIENLEKDYGALSDPPPMGTLEYDRCVSSDLSYPIMVIKEKSGSWIGDGNHRFVKAFHIQGLDTIKAYVITQEMISEGSY